MVSSKTLCSLLALAVATQALDFRIDILEHSFFSGAPPVSPGPANSADFMTSDWHGCDQSTPSNCDQHNYSIGDGDLCGATTDAPFEVCSRQFHLEGHGPTCGSIRPDGAFFDGTADGERYAFLHEGDQCLGSCYVDHSGNNGAMTCGLGSTNIHSALRCFDDGNC